MLAIVQLMLMVALVAWLGAPLLRRTHGESRGARRARSLAAYAVAALVPGVTTMLYGYLGAPEAAAANDDRTAQAMAWMQSDAAPYIAAAYGVALVLLGGLVVHTWRAGRRPRR